MPNDPRPYVFSCDAHVAEPNDLFVVKMPPHLQQHAPRLVETDLGNGKLRRLWKIGERVVMTFPTDFPAHKTGKTDAEFQMQSGDSVVDTRRRGARDLSLRAADMDRDGVDAELVFPTAGLLVAAIEDREAQRVASEIWNDWVWDYTVPLRQRLVPVAIIPSHDFDDALAECRRTAAKGFAAFCLYEGLNNYNDPRWDPIFAFAGEMGIPIVFHTGFGDIDVRPLKGAGGALYNYVRLMNDSVDIIAQLVGGGVLDRHPQAHILFAEHSAGWLWSLAERMDEVYIGHANSVLPKLSRMPSQIVRDQVHCSLQNDVGSSVAARHGVGLQALLFATDYPHSEGTFPFTRALIQKMQAQHQDLSAQDLAQILGGNAVRLFGRAQLQAHYAERTGRFLQASAH